MDIGYIYKITSPKKRIYIGQTVNYVKRFSDYRCLNCKKQIKLYNSFNKHGVDSHIFEIISECDVNDLNRLERYYQDLFNCSSKNGLNLRLVSANDRSGKHSDESKRLMSISRKRVIQEKRANGTLVWSDQQRERRELARINNPYKASEETKEKARIRNTGKVMPQEVKDKISASKKGKVSWNKGVSQSEERKKRHSSIMKGKNAGEESILSKLILNIETGIYYKGAKEAAISIGRYSHNHINDMLRGNKTNKTSFIRV